MADRGKVISDLERWIDWMGEDAPVVACDALELLKEQPEREKGHWIDNGDPQVLVCDKCGYRVNRWNNTEYCPKCGAYMLE